MQHQSENGGRARESVVITSPTDESTAGSPGSRAPVPRRKRGGQAVTPVLESTDGAGTFAESTADELRPPAGEPSEPRTLPGAVSYEVAAYLVMIGAAIISRFWDLGEKALHHDESLHAYYSWVYATGDGYAHDPLMHGPFLFHANALVYLLFGDTDATSRYMPAFFGVLVVAMPYLLRGQKLLGKWGALAASFLFLVSPSILYQSRYIRHDIYTVAGALFLFICIVRYLERPSRRWLILGSATIAFLLTNHEIVFAILAIFFGYVYAALMVEQYKAIHPVEPRRAYELVTAHLAYVVGLALLYFLVPDSTRAELLDIPWENPTRHQENEYYKTVLTNPLILGAILLTAALVIVLFWLLIRGDRRAAAGAESPPPAQPDDHSVTRAVKTAWADKVGLLLALGAGLLIFVPLYTSMFTNMHGLRSATISTDGTLLYWLGQHDYRRGEQPWFYFLLLLPQYEYLAVFLGGLMAVIVFIRSGAALLGWSGGRQLFFRLFLATWFVLIFAGLSYAGEKMPWLVVHITLPGILLAAVLIGAMLEQAARAVSSNGPPEIRRSWFGLSLREIGLVGGLLLTGLAFIWVASRLTYGMFVEDPAGQRGGWRRTITPESADNWWWLAIPFVVAAGLVLFWAFWRGAKTTAIATLAAVVVGLALLQIHTGWRLNYYNADVPRDALVYTQTSPDVTRVMDEIDQLSAELTGGRHLEVWFDSEVSWPYQWYLRNYDNKRFVGSLLNQDPGDAPILLLDDSIDDQANQFLQNYTRQDYVLRWWFPEETYRDFAIAPEISVGRSAWKSVEQPHGPIDVLRSIGDTFGNELDPENQLRLYRLLMYRDLDWELGQTRFSLYVRDDLIPLYNGIRYP